MGTSHLKNSVKWGETFFRGEPLREAYGERVSRLQGALGLRPMDLADRLFVESLTRRRRVPREQSGVAVVQRRDLEPIPARLRGPLGGLRPASLASIGG